MKNLINILLILVTSMLFTKSFSQNTYVPDDNFEQALINLGYDTLPLNDSVPTANISTIKRLFVSYRGIVNFTGIEDFTVLDTLICTSPNDTILKLDLSSNLALLYLRLGGSHLDSLDITNNTSLKYLNIQSTKLKSINLSNNTALQYLYIDNNFLDSIDLSNNINLTHLNIANNILLDSLDVSNNTNLIYLKCTNDSLKSLNISNNLLLRELYCDRNNLDTLDLSNNDSLRKIACQLNQLTSLNTSNLLKLQSFNCSHNQINNLDVSQNNNLITIFCAYNSLSDLNLANSNNINIVSFNSFGNPSLRCIKVDSVRHSAANWFSKDSLSYFSIDCSIPLGSKTYIPDNNFELYLNQIGLDNGGMDDSIVTAAIDTVTYLTIIYKNISSLKGIEDFDSLEYLNCTRNLLTDLDVTQNTKLTYLNFMWQQIDSIDLSNNVLIDTLICRWNQLTELDLSANVNLEYLDCGGNLIDTLDLVNNPQLSYLKINDNQIDGLLDLSNNNKINFIWGDNNLIDSINLQNCTDIDWIQFNWNELTSLNVSNNSKLRILTCHSNDIVHLDVSKNPLLTQLSCIGNQLVSLNANNGNKNFNAMSAHSNPSLSCIQVNDTSFARANWSHLMSPSVFNLNCGFVRRNTVDSTSCNNYILPSGLVLTNDTIFYLDTIKTSSGLNDSIIDVLNFTKDTIRDTLNQVSFLTYISPSGIVLTSDSTGFMDTIVNSSGCVTISTINLTINTCRAEYSKTQPTPGQVTLIDSTVGNNLKYTWYFGDGDSSTTMLPTHNYASAGTYNVCLKIIDIVGGCTDIYCDSITVDSLGILRNAWVLKVIRNYVSVDKPEQIIDNVRVYPNPNNGSFTLYLDKEILLNQIFITDINGRIVKEIIPQNIPKQKINFDGSSGVYFIRLITSEGNRALRLIKQ